MPRRTGYKTKGALSTLVLGNPDLGTSAWETEYDIEYTDSYTRQVQRDREERVSSARASLRTPRSLKKGYVLDEDYQKLDGQYSQALSAYRELQLQLGTLEQRVATMQGSENLFLRAVEDQHELIDTLKQQVAGLSESLGRLLGGVERNRSLMALMSSMQPQEAPLEPAVAANKETDISQRLSSLEAKISDMADAITALARSQSHLLAAKGFPAAHHHGHGRDGQRPGNRATARYSERIERLPNPLQLTSSNSTWKP